MCLNPNIDSLIRANRLEEAMVLLKEYIAANPSDARALYLRGKAWWRMGERSKAMSDYAASASIEPDGIAQHALEHARDIEDFFNPDLLNP